MGASMLLEDRRVGTDSLGQKMRIVKAVQVYFFVSFSRTSLI